MDNQQKSFLDTIGRSDLEAVLTPDTPWAYFSMEIGLLNFSFAGGLGILAGDTYLQAGKINLPFVGVTLFYPVLWRQHLKDYMLVKEYREIHPDDFNFKKECEVSVFANSDAVPLQVYSYEMNRKKIFVLYEPGIGKLYHGDASGEHRLYQEIVLGFGGYEALKKLGYSPSLIHLNESPMDFAALAYLDDLCSDGMEFQEALKKVRSKTLFTNHTLVPSAVAVFNTNLFERYVFKNIKTEAVKKWVYEMLGKQGGRLNLSLLGFELCEKLNGVSRLHSEIASKEFKKIDGSEAKFRPITNGIYMQRWIARELYRMYWQSGIIDEFDLPLDKYKEHIDNLYHLFFHHIKSEAKKELIDYLKGRTNQNGQSVVIDEDMNIAVWAKRFADYKRPGMIFEDQERLLKILLERNMCLIMTGDIHLTGGDARQEVKDIVARVTANKELGKRVHFVQDYDQTLAKYLTAGADIWLNTPEVGKEACGTSWMKAVGNLSILISTEDGGVADDVSGSYLKITGSNYQEELDSLYTHLDTAGQLLENKEEWFNFVKKQLKTYIPIISGGRMIKDYLDFVFPK